MKVIIVFSGMCLVLLLSGCVSGAIVGSGKRHDYLSKDSTTMELVEKRLGTPTWSRYYPNQVKIRNSDEYRAYIKDSDGDTPFIWGTEETAEERFISYCAVYTRTGPYEEALRGQGYGMVGGMTLGVGDVICLPFAISERIELSNNIFSLTMWFDENHQYVGVFEGDINDVNSDFYSGKSPEDTVTHVERDSLKPVKQTEEEKFWLNQ